MTATPERKAFVAVDGEEVEAKFSTNGLCAVENEFGGQSLEAIGTAMEKGQTSFSAVRAIFRAVLLHAKPELTPVSAGRIIGDIGMDETGRLIKEAFEVWRAGAMATAVKLPEVDAQGRLAFEAGGVRYVLAFGFNAMAEIEPTFPGMGMPQIADALLNDGVSVSRLRAMFRAALVDQREVSLWEAGEIMDAIGTATVSEAVGKAFVSAFPKVPENDGDQGAEGNRQARRAAASASKANPTKPRARKGGTGTP